MQNEGVQGCSITPVTYTPADTLWFCSPICWSRFPSRLLQVSTLLCTLGISSLFNAMLIEQRTWEASAGMFFNFACNCCICFLLPSNQLLWLLTYPLVVHYCTSPYPFRVGVVDNVVFSEFFLFSSSNANVTDDDTFFLIFFK